MLKDILLTLRKEKRYTQADVAKLLCISRQAYNHYETGVRIPPTDTLQELANVFSVSTDYLLGVDNSTNKNTRLSEADRRVQQLFEEKPIMRDLVDAISRLDESQQLALLEYAEFQAQKYKQKD